MSVFWGNRPPCNKSPRNYLRFITLHLLTQTARWRKDLLSISKSSFQKETTSNPKSAKNSKQVCNSLRELRPTSLHTKRKYSSWKPRYLDYKQRKVNTKRCWTKKAVSFQSKSITTDSTRWNKRHSSKSSRTFRSI